MYYRLAWPEVLIQRLAACYLMAKADGLADKFTSAIAVIEKTLVESPAEHGESRSGSDRIMVVPPLAVTYRIDEPAKVVYIVGVGYSPGR